MTKAQRRELEDAIRAAFDNVPVPLTVAENCWERDSEQVFLGRHWKTLVDDVDQLRRHAVMLAYFTSEAFQHYLPAFLLVSLFHRRKADVIPDNLVYTLTPDDRNTATLNRRVQLFTPEQKNVIAQFLAYQPNGRRALSHYWHRWLP